MNNKYDHILGYLKHLGIKNSKIIKSELYCSPVIIYSDEIRYEDHISDLWVKVFDNFYEKIVSKKDSFNDTSVWKSSYTKECIPKYEISDWVDGFIKKIDRYITKNTSVLEIGCGNGLILKRVISRVKHYTGVDSSFFGIESIKNSSAFENNRHKILLHHCDASEIDKINEGKYDLIILNSVIQYFSSTEYLLDLLSTLQQKVKPSTIIAIGDVRSFHTSDLHYYEIVKSRKNLKVYGEKLKNKINSLDKVEKETLYSPILFKTLHLFLNWISATSVISKSSFHLNEMTKYRYDVIIYCKDPNEIKPKCKNHLLHVESEDLFSDPKEQIKFDKSQSINCKRIVNPNLHEIFVKFSKDLNYKRTKHKYVASYRQLLYLHNILIKYNLFFDLYDHGNLNELYFFASRDHLDLSNIININKIDLFQLSNRITSRAPIPLIEFVKKTNHQFLLKKSELENYYIYKVPSFLMRLFPIK